ncbi:MAG: DUF4276 family protein [Bacteroidetes bacterium]|nr:DUF4276 family protein [Bacteroidota bacterium]
MVHVNILVEGQTEEQFVKLVLYPYLLSKHITLVPIIISTKRLREGGKFKGGLTNSNFDNFIDDLTQLLRSTPHGYVTTFVDFYALPSRFPGYQERLGKRTQLEKVEFLEQKLAEHLGSPTNFIPYIQLHEFEALLFSDKSGFENLVSPSDAKLEKLKAIIDSYPNPEDINEGAETAPSKRILANYPGYNKVVEGNMLAIEIGMDKLMEKCGHFRAFIEKLISLPKR